MTDAREPEGIYIAHWDERELLEDGLQMPSHVEKDDQA